MYTVMGITGQIGGVVGHALLAANQQVRAVVRDADKGRAWADRGCEVALATIEDEASLTTAFRGAEGVFVLVPSSFDPTPGFPEARAIGVTLRAALAAGSPARAQGVIPTFRQPLDKPVPMVATADIGGVAARLLQENWTGRRVVELEGPQRVTPNEIAATFAGILQRPVRMEVVPRESWEKLFTAQGMKNPSPRLQMLDGFNEGWIDFERGASGSEKGSVPLETVLKALTKREAKSP